MYGQTNRRTDRKMNIHIATSNSLDNQKDREKDEHTYSY